MAKDTPELVIVDGSSRDNNEHTQLILSVNGADTDRVVLSAMAADSRRSRSLSDAIRALVADRILALNIPRGAEMVLPVSGVILRTVGDTRLGHDALVDLFFELKKTEEPDSKFKKGLVLGDRAAHFAAGYTGNRNLRRIMGDQDVHEHAKNMARTGYGTALDAAQRLKTAKVHGGISSVRQLIRRFRDLVDVLLLVRDTKLIQDIQRRKALKGVAPAAC